MKLKHKLLIAVLFIVLVMVVVNVIKSPNKLVIASDSV